MYTIRGKVRKGKTRGKDLGFPTANIALRKVIPEGVYLSKTKISSKKYPSLTFIGKAKTFGEKIYQAETYILDFYISIYNQLITVVLIKKIRDNKKFGSSEELIKQMKEDEKVARDYFKT